MSEGVIRGFAIFGAGVCLGLICVFITIVIEYAKKRYEKYKRAYKYRHRFDKKPIVACYCVDCVNYGQGPYKESCGLSGVERAVGDSEFCCHAEPKNK